MRVYFTFKKQCPKCKHEDMARLPRRKWMRFIPNSRFYECNFCRSEILVVLMSKKRITAVHSE